MGGHLSTKHFYYVRLSVGFLTITCLLLLQLLPAKKLTLFPGSQVTIDAYADSINGGGSEAKWAHKPNRVLSCLLKSAADFPYCGASIKFFTFTPKEMTVARSDNYGYKRMRSIDLSHYDTLELELDYAGEATGLRLFLRNAFEMPKNLEEHNAQKFLYLNLAKREFGKPITIALGDLKVADWWLNQYNIERKDSSIDVSRIFEIGIDFPGRPPMGQHLITIKSIKAVGQWVSDSTLYILLISLWLGSLIYEGSYRVYRLATSQRAFNHAINQLRDENSALRQSAQTDALTGIYNRNGLGSLLDGVFPIQGRNSLSLVIMDLDHFKKVNDTYGHAVGDEVLMAFCLAIKAQLRTGDIFARWGGEEFILISNVSAHALPQLMQRLTTAVANLTVVTPESISVKVTTSMGATTVQKEETLAQSFVRADAALYEAKAAGRNTWRENNPPKYQ